MPDKFKCRVETNLTVSLHLITTKYQIQNMIWIIPKTLMAYSMVNPSQPTGFHQAQCYNLRNPANKQGKNSIRGDLVTTKITAIPSAKFLVEKRKESEIQYRISTRQLQGKRV